MMELNPAQLSALAAVVSEGTFDAAARRLHVTPSAISQRLKALETSVGRVLVTRDKPVTPTESGRAILQLARQLQSLTEDAMREIGADEATGPTMVSMAVNADSLDTWLLPALTAAGPDLVFDLRREDEDQTVELLRTGAVMAAITSVSKAVPGCSVRRLGQMRYRACASADLAAKWFSGGVTTDSLAVAPVVVYDRGDTLQDQFIRRWTRRRLEPPRHYVPASNAFAIAVRVGLGWGLIPEQQVSDDLRRGTLIDLDPGRAVAVPLYWQQWKLRSSTLQAVAEAVQGAALEALG
jgi:LysR family transcriptional regulator (chromosome initiation inhibitor)